MTIFDLLFLLAILASVVTLALAVVLAFCGRLASALKILRVYAIGALAYLASGRAVSYLRPQKGCVRESRGVLTIGASPLTT
jgi:hypothetical protein